MASYSYDLLGRGTQVNYTGGGSDSWTYTRDSRVAAKNLETLSYDKIGNITQWNSNGTDGAVSYSYTGTHGSKALGLPSASTGSGNIGSYAYTYNTKYLLYTMADTSKIAQSYTYSYSTANQITGLLYPNQTSTGYIYDNKQLDSIQVQQLNVSPPINWLATDSTYNSDGQRTAYNFSVTNGQGGSFAENHGFSYDTAGRMASMTYQNAQRTVDFGYNASTGLMNELDYSDLGTYTLSHDTAGRLSSVTYPDTSQESYTYQGDLGRLSQIQYPNNQSLGFSWNSQGQVSQLQVNDNGTLSSYAFNYNTRGKLASYSKTVGGITTEQWYLFHGPQGLEKAQRLQYGMLNLTLDFTTDPRGRILSMTHTPSGGAQGFTGEVYFHYDNAGNTSLLTNASGAPLASFQHDALSGMLLNAWNPQNITVINANSQGDIKIQMMARVVVLNHVIIIPGFTPIVIDAEDRIVTYNPPKNSENNSDFIECKCNCDPESMVEKNGGSVDKSAIWFQDAQKWFNDNFHNSCDELKRDSESDEYGSIGDLKRYYSFKMGLIDGSWYDEDGKGGSEHHWGRYGVTDDRPDGWKWPHWNDAKPWDDNAWDQMLHDIYGDDYNFMGQNRTCSQMRTNTAKLQMSDCLLNCCGIHIWGDR